MRWPRTTLPVTEKRFIEMLTFDEIFAALRGCVLYSSFLPEWGRLNTFGVLDKRSDLLESGLGLGYDDFLEGYFWSRRWVYGGADPNQLEKEYGLLTVEHKNSRLKSLEQMETWTPMSLGVFLLRDCDEVDGLLPRKKVELMAARNMWRVLSRLSKLMKWKLVKSGGGVEYGWMTEEEKAALEALGSLSGYSEVNMLGRSFGGYMKPEGNEWEVYMTNFELGDNVVSVGCDVVFHTCEADGGEWDYDVPEIGDNLGIVIC